MKKEAVFIFKTLYFRPMTMRRSFDLSVYFVADPSVCGGRSVESVVRAAVKGGASMVQLRNKSGDMKVIEREAYAIQEVLYNSDVAFIINDYVDLAVKIGADGVHIGQQDISPAKAREMIGEAAILGLTAYRPEHFAVLDSSVVDYVGTGPFYATKTKPDKPVLGADGFVALARISPVPMVGIGGITTQNAMQVMQAGADGVAMMRSVSEADDPAAAAKLFWEEVQKFK